MSTLCSQPEECKFTHLLQPIRDLAANWDINIASELEEYLVSSACVSFYTAISEAHPQSSSLLSLCFCT